MAVRFRITDSTRERIERARNILRRRAAITMGATVVGAALLLAVIKVFRVRPSEPSFVIYNEVVEVSDEPEEKNKPVKGGDAPVSPPVVDIVVADVDVALDTTFTLDVDMADPSGTEYTGEGDGDGLGDGVGSGSTTGGMGGSKQGSGFAGIFFDFKKKADGKDSVLAGKNPTYNGDVLQIESRFVNNSWNLNNFGSYFRPKVQLYASCFYMPNSLDKEACNAYDPEGRYHMKPGRWAAIYRASVQAPVSGKFRFVGVADSVMAVRFDGKNVLFCGHHNVEKAKWNEWNILVNPNATRGRDLYAYENCEAWNEIIGGFVAGSEFTVKEGQWYEMQVMVSEIGGGEFGFCLLIDDLNQANKKRTPNGQPLFQLFRTNFSLPNAKDAYAAIKFKSEGAYTDPPYDEDSRVWPAKPINPDKKMK